jgi:hypothetical protein
MSFTGDLMAGLAGYLATQGVGTYRATGTYTADEVGIVHDVVPASPARIVVLTPYGHADASTQAETDASVQIRVRGTADPRTAYELDDAAFAAVQNLPRTVMGGVTVVAAWRTSSAYLGVDSNARHERSSNYRLRVHRPSLHRI